MRYFCAKNIMQKIYDCNADIFMQINVNPSTLHCWMIAAGVDAGKNVRGWMIKCKGGG